LSQRPNQDSGHTTVIPIPPRIAQHYEHPIIAGPGTGRTLMTGDSAATTNWLTKTIEFKKILFTKPINIVTSEAEETALTATNTDSVIVRAARDALVRFEDCQFFGTTGTNAITDVDYYNPGTTINFATTANTATTGIYYYDTNGQLITDRNGILQWTGKPLSKKEQFLQQLKARRAPALIRSRAMDRGADFNGVQQNEMVALQLLRKMVPHDVFKKYLKYGFVTVRGPSGVEYQIRRREHVIYAWMNGKKVANLCVYLQDTSIPPTDEVVAKMLICECDEKDIWKRANITWFIQEKLKIAA